MSGEMIAKVTHDSGDDKIHISHSQDVSGILAANKRAREQSDGRRCNHTRCGSRGMDARRN